MAKASPPPPSPLDRPQRLDPVLAFLFLFVIEFSVLAYFVIRAVDGLTGLVE